LILGITCPLVLAQDVLRFAAMALGLPGRALIWDGAWAAASLLALIGAWSGWLVKDSISALAVWGAGAAFSLAGLSLTGGVWPRLSQISAWIVRNARQRIAFGLESSVGALSTVLVFGIASYTLGDVATAALRGAGTVFGPLSIVMSALPLFIVPESVREGRDMSSTWNRLRRPGIALSMMSLCTGIVGFVLPDKLGQIVLGATWGVAKPLLPITALEYSLAVWLSCLFTALRSAGRGTALLRLRVLYLMLTFGFIVAATTAADVRALAVALAGSVAVAFAIGLRGIRSHHHQSPQARAKT
jgi:hypothetical protein